jgi:hypothetical protein
MTPRVDMRKARNWLTRRFQTFSLLPDYFRALARCWQDVLWGEGVIAVAFTVWWLLGNPPARYIAFYLVAALFVAGYYTWRSDHIRLIPQFEIKDSEIQENPTTDSNQVQVYVQVVPKCLTDAGVKECKAYLLRVYKRHNNQDNWQPTELNEPMLLEWSFHKFAPFTLQPGIDQRLNVCFWSNRASRIVPRIEQPSVRYLGVFNPPGMFRFEIKATAENCAPVDISVEVTNDGCEWNRPMVKLL